jgi:erythromycin esterase-like protein
MRRKSSIDEFVEWARERAIHFASPELTPENVAKLGTLDESLRAKRIVYLGEGNHFTHEKYGYRLMLISYLASRGFRIVGEEMGFSDGVRINRFIETGDSNHLDRVATYGYRGAMRTDRNDEATGLLSDAFAPSFPETEFRSEQRTFAAGLYRIREERPDHRLRFFGFDVDYVPGSAYEDIEEMLSPVAGQSPTRELRDVLKRVAGESIEDEIARLEKASGLISTKARKFSEILDPDALDFVVESITSLRESLEYVAIGYHTDSWDEVNKAMAVRERSMRRRIESVLTRGGTDEKLVLTSHNMHLSKNIRAVREQTYLAGPGGGSDVSVGTALNDRFAGKVFSIWMLCDHGTDSQPYRDLRNKVTSPPDSLNAALNRVGECYLLPTASTDSAAALLRSEAKIAMGGGTVTAAIADQADAIFFIGEVSPLRASS